MIKIVTPIAEEEVLPLEVYLAVEGVVEAFHGSEFSLERGSATNKLKAIADNRNRGTAGYTKFDGVLYWDSDTIGKPNDVESMIELSGGERIVSAAYRYRGDRKAVCASTGKDGTYDIPTSTQGVVPVKMVGAGFLYAPRKALKKMRSTGRKKWFESRTIGGVQVGEDVCFCMNAVQCGIEIVVDCDHFVNHLLSVER